jgi:hypothetical protein
MRFSLKHHGQLSCVEHCPEGEYVLHSDYARLKAEVERLRAGSFVTAVPAEEHEKLRSELDLIYSLDPMIREAVASAKLAREGGRP